MLKNLHDNQELSKIYVYNMLLCILFMITILILIIKNIQYEGFKNTSCENRHKAISRYPKNKHIIDPLYDAKFKPKCCPSPYSNSSGCLCSSINHSELIIMRGGNRIMC